MYVTRNLGFIAHPKTASQSVSQALLDTGWQRMGGHHDVRPMNSDVKTFCVIRDPRDWLVSWCFYLQVKEPFEQWLREWTNPLLETHGAHWFGLPTSECVLFYHELQSGIDALFDDWRVRHVNLSLINVSMTRNGIRAASMFDSEFIERVYRESYGNLDNEFHELLSQKGTAPYLRREI